MRLGLRERAADPGLGTRLAWITGLRLGLLALLFGATVFFYLRGDLSRYPVSQSILFYTFGAGFALAAAYAIFLRGGTRLRELAYAQILLDQLTWTAIVYVSGGATSGATSLYGLTCLVGAVLVGMRGATIAAISGFSLYTVMTVGLASGEWFPPSDQLHDRYTTTPDAVLFPVLVNVLGIVVVALLAGYLADRLRRTGGALVIATQRAEDAERLAVLGRIAAGLAHEIRNPLGSISGSIEMLKESPALSEEDRKLCEIVQRESARLNHLVTDMMDLARPRAPAPEPVDVASLARETCALAARSDRGGSGDVTVRYEGPEGALWATCDGEQMRQVLWNLIRNAVQASGAGTEVLVGVATRGDHVELDVTDRGEGIPTDSRARVFDAFYTTRTHGAGIGLAVVRRVIDDHAPWGASIEVEAPEGGGARFRVRLASVKPPSTSLAAAPASKEKALPEAPISAATRTTS